MSVQSMSAAAATPHSPGSVESTESVNSIGAVQKDVENRLRAVEYMQSVLEKSSSPFCSLELFPLLQIRKRPLEEMKQRCVLLSEYGAENHLW